MGNSIIKRPTEQIDNQEIEKRSNIASSISFSETFLKHQNSNNEEEESADNQQLKTRWSFGYFQDFRRNHSLINSISKSITNFSLSRNLSKSTSKLSSIKLSTQAKTNWPVPTVIQIFLPQFKLVSQSTVEKDYRINGVIARGAFGKVYRAEKIDEHQIYAIKILSKAQIIRDNAVEQLKNEVSIQTICGNNTFIVKCLTFWQTHREIYLLSELVSGGELFQRIEKFSHKLIQLYVAEIAIALDFLHNAGVIYRDLKPENILLDDNLHIKLTDFGLSKWLKIGQRTRTICGTLQYMGRNYLNIVINPVSKRKK